MVDNVANILYADDNNLWAPVKSLYWSHESGICISRHMKSAIEEIVSHYCPQCCTRYMDDEAMTNHGRCPSCYQCPRCCSILSMIAQGSASSALFCAMCTWKSKEYEGNISNKVEILKKVKDDIVNNTQVTAFNDILKNFKSLQASSSNNITKKPSYHSLSTTSTSSATAIETNHIALETGSSHQVLPIVSNISSAIVSQRIASTNPSHMNIELLKPHGVPLRGKKMIRCRKDFDNAKMNILIQPKATPLEGDSSTRIQRGKWWMKDSSAIHEIPTITLLGSYMIHDMNTFMMKVMISNPKESTVNCEVYFPDMIVDGPPEPIYCLTESQPLRMIDTYERITLSVEDRHNPMRKLELVLGSYEDELLRDDDDDDASTSMSSPMASTDTNHDTSSSGIQHRLVNNVAYVSIPVKVSSLEHPMAALDILFQIIKVGDEAVDRVPIRIKICLPIRRPSQT